MKCTKEKSLPSGDTSGTSKIPWRRPSYMTRFLSLTVIDIDPSNKRPSTKVISRPTGGSSLFSVSTFPSDTNFAKRRWTVKIR